ncbi:MAG: T9SS type A sorting domain-containing protein [Saprospiraceae bacterium]
MAQWQGWYAHDVAVDPKNPNRLIYVGIDAWRSNNGGHDLKQLSYWQHWQFGKTAVGSPEGPAQYVHADIHAVYYHPADANQVFVATDGGIFASTDGGTSWQSRNGGYQTQQFYADFASATRDSNLAVGGLQDNSTVIYDGEAAWSRRIGGDGMNAAIDPENHQLIYGSLQNLQVLRSIDRGKTFRRMVIGSSASEIRNFNSPFVLDPADPTRIYAGAQHLYISEDQGITWNVSTDQDGENSILRIAVAPSDAGLIYLSTNSVDGSQSPGVFKLSEGRASTWQRMQGLPEQICTDLVFHPNNEEEVYVLFGGYNNPHVFHSRDNGQSWQSIDNNLPDLPTHTLFIDPEHPQHLYVGNDMGVFFSENGGKYWQWISRELAEAVMVMDLSYSPSNRKLRVATHGLGAYELALDGIKITPSSDPGPILTLSPPFPNPTSGSFSIKWQSDEKGELTFQVIDVPGRILETHQISFQAGEKTEADFDLSARANGVYWIVVEDSARIRRWTFRVLKTK